MLKKKPKQTEINSKFKAMKSGYYAEILVKYWRDKKSDESLITGNITAMETRQQLVFYMASYGQIRISELSFLPLYLQTCYSSYYLHNRMVIRMLWSSGWE